MKTRESVTKCRFCGRTADEVVDKGGAMVTPTRCSWTPCVVAFEREGRRGLRSFSKAVRIGRRSR